MFSLPYLDISNLSKIGIWETNGKIVAIATYEQGLGSAYFCIDRQYDFLKSEMLLYTKDNMFNAEGELKVLINNTNREFQQIASKYGFKPTQKFSMVQVKLFGIYPDVSRCRINR